MNIGIIITRIGGVDGVALETEKWIEVLEKRQGHKTFILTGRIEREGFNNITEFPPLYLYDDFNNEEQDAAFFKQTLNEDEIKKLIDDHTNCLKEEFSKWVKENKIDCLVSQNASALPCHLSMGKAIKEFVDETKIPAVLYLHDFYWERPSRYSTGSKFVKNVMEECFPPRGENYKYAVINTYNKELLNEKFDIDPVKIPNVMDFNQSFGQTDECNKDFLERLGLKESDIILSQVTRIVKRKGIETAIRLVAKLKGYLPNIKLLITGYPTDAEENYFEELHKMVTSHNLSDNISFVYEKVDHHRRNSDSCDSKVYSLSDVYAYSQGCTYFSTYEGFGNAFVEAILAKCPIFVNNYKPVYWLDIGRYGFKTVMLENNELKDEHIREVVGILSNKELRREMVEHNYEIGKRYFSFEVLDKKLKEILK